jgi:hypothetical protein
MEKGRKAQFGAATGIVSAVLLIVGFGIVGQDIPRLDDSAQEWGRFFADHQDRIQIGITVLGVGMFFFLWFLGSLRDAIAAAEGGTGRLASIAYGGGLISVGLLGITLTGFATAAFRPEELDPTVTLALNDFGALAAAPAASAIAALFAATAVAGYRHQALPAPVAGISALAAVGALPAYGVVFTDSGAFAPDGVVGLWVPVVTFVIAILAISGTLVSKAGESPRAVASQ